MRGKTLQSMLDGLERGVKQNQGDSPANHDGVAAFNELKNKLEIAEAVVKFYKEMSLGQRLLVDGVLPADLLALLKKGI